MKKLLVLLAIASAMLSGCTSTPTPTQADIDSGNLNTNFSRDEQPVKDTHATEISSPNPEE